MFESTFVIDLARPALANELYAEGEERRSADQLLAEARTLAASTISDEVETTEDAAGRLGRAAGLMLALAQPHAPSTGLDTQTDELIYALRVLCVARRHQQDANPGVRMAENMEMMLAAFNEVDDTLGQLRIRPDDGAASSQLLAAAFDAAAAAIGFLDAGVGTIMAAEHDDAPDDHFLDRSEIELSDAAERAVMSFGELPLNLQDQVLERIADSRETRDSFTLDQIWHGAPKLRRFLEQFVALQVADKDMALRACAWVVSDHYESADDAAGHAREHRAPHSSTIIACFGTWEDAKEAALGRVSEEERQRAVEERLQEQEQERFRGVGRNEPCPCGSGKKFKQCHGA